MTTPYSDKYKKLVSLHKTLVDSIALTEKDISQCSLEWLQLCDISKRQNENLKGTIEVNKPDTIDKTFLTNVEDISAINNQSIDVDIKFVKEQQPSDEEFDSD